MSVRRTLIVPLVLVLLAGCGSRDGRGAPAPGPTTAPPSAADSSASAAHAPTPSTASSAPRTGTAAAAAAAFVTRQPGTLGIVVRDRNTGAVWRAGATTATTWTASTIKLAIAADLLERNRAGQLTLDATDRANLDRSLVDSSNDATTALWQRHDGPGMIERFRGRYGMGRLSVVPGHEPFWRHLRCSAEDLQVLMSYVLEKLATDDRAYLVNSLRKVNDDQRWGVWAAGGGLRPGNKAGWAQKPTDGRTHWVTHTVGFAGDAERYVVAVMYRLPPSGSLSGGVHVVSDLVATYFAAPVPAKVSTPPS